MKFFQGIALIIIGIFGFNQCTKDQNSKPLNNEDSGESLFRFGQLGPNIIISDSSDNNYLWQARNYIDSVRIDVDKDKTPDFLLISDYYYSNGGNSRLMVQLVPLSSYFEIAVSSQADTIKRGIKQVKDTSYTAIFNTFSDFSSSKPVESLYPSPFTSSPRFEMNASPGIQQWSNDSVMLLQRNDSMDHFDESFKHIHQGFWVSEEKSYLLFRKINGNDSKLGWLKLSSLNKLKITYWESAIQN